MPILVLNLLLITSLVTDIHSSKMSYHVSFRLGVQCGTGQYPHESCEMCEIDGQENCNGDCQWIETSGYAMNGICENKSNSVLHFVNIF